MSETSLFQFLEGALSQVLGRRPKVLETRRLGGGCIHQACYIKTGEQAYFVKWNESVAPDMFGKEADGLRLLSETRTVRIPEVMGSGSYLGKDFLVLEYLTPAASAHNYWEKLGEELAMLHLVRGKQHGLAYDNYIGRLDQVNAHSDSWVGFFIEHRLKEQLALACRQGLINQKLADKFEGLYELLPDLIPELQPSLLHGDLWSGNVHRGADGHAWLIDPAVYYGSREVELAFTYLFGGFDPNFYASYAHHFPLEPGFEERIALYNLYPLLVHVNLFGKGYLSGIEQTLSKYVR